MRKLAQAAVLLFLAAWIIMPHTKNNPPSNSISAPTAVMPPKATKTTIATPRPASTCSIGQPASSNVVAVIDEFAPRTAPSNEGHKIKNEKASSILGSIRYHQIDSSTTVKQLCTEGDWSEVQIVTPEWLTHVRGWVPTKILRGIERTSAGTRVYVETDFIWDDDTSKFMPQIVAVTNKIAQEHSGCSDLDTASVALSPSRSKPKDPVFFVTCNPSSGAPFNVWFRPSEAGKTFAAVTPISQSDAVLACERAAKAAATRPSTVDFSKFLDVAYSVRQDGRVALDSTFTAKNAFNVHVKYTIRCLFDGRTLIESSIVEAN
ncbi:hypothetical protein X753_19835 [Mesorhizobium sp. LNJC399B00]|uniref:hypothetical protein n=1 Tax=unclassified Mesorhizobium TaxID=325217 RepID=UPI0003CE2135|nr:MULTISPECIES: hypothetical protein [unclassified Mesorhizobium]ESY03371.1 hypothetical protein X753_19835 [Mesorhizobium sp. LNJC399B00]WJI67244.1 hypothetical protein NLY36_20350 [Mesorhizobium sp. C399B]